MEPKSINRRVLMSGAAAVAVSAGASPARAELVSGSNGFEFEIKHTDEEWRDLLTDHEYSILRDGGTEDPRTSAYYDFEDVGDYHCKGCDLPVYTSHYKVNWPKKGWVFFFHGMPNNVLMGVDKKRPSAYGSAGMAGPAGDLIETHCRRCGSHLGHVLHVSLFVMHCINGAALNFQAAKA